MKAICQHYIGSTEEWKTANPKLYKAVWGFETTKDGKVLAKLGNGEDHWNNLKYFDIENIYGLPEELAATLANAKSYTDLKVNEEAQARIQGDANTLASAKTYTNEKVSAEEQARIQGDANTLASAKTYTNEKVGAEEQARIQGDANTLASAKTYTNEKVGAEEQARIQGDAATLTSAKTYTNEKVSAEEQARIQGDAATLAIAKTYTNEKVGAEEQARIQGDAATLTSAKTYTNEEVSAEEQARIQGDAATLAIAKTYTNEKVGAEEQAREEADNNLRLMIAALTPGGVDDLEDISNKLALKANIASPTFTGTPQVPSKTAAATSDGTLIATEAQVKAVADVISSASLQPPKNSTVDIANLQATINDVPRLLLGDYNIYVRPGTLASAVTVYDFYGPGTLNIRAVDSSGNVIEANGTTHNILSINVARCSNNSFIIQGFNGTATTGKVFLSNANSANVHFRWCSTTSGSSGTAEFYGIAAFNNGGTTRIRSCVISNKWRAITAEAATVYVESIDGSSPAVSGDNNRAAFCAFGAGHLGINRGQNLTGTDLYEIFWGGIIVDGGYVMNVQGSQYYLGYVYTQLPGGFTPAELVTKGVFPSGTWADWTARAEIYELIPTASYPASTPATYASGQTIAVNDLRIYQMTGDDRQIWKANKAIASTPSQMNPKDWDLLLSSSIVRVRRCDLQTSWTAADHAIGATVTYNNTSYRVVGILVLGGKYLAGAGGNRPTFNGGTVPDAIRNFTGEIHPIATERLIYQDVVSTDVFSNTSLYDNAGNQGSGLASRIALKINPSLVVPTANENQPRTMAVRYWRRTA